MANVYQIKISIDGSDVKSEAGKVRELVEAELAKIQVAGAIDIRGLDALAAKMKEVRKDAGSLGRALAEPVTEQAEKQATGLLRLWEWVSDKLVGRSVIPDMVADINAWLARVDPELFGADALVVAADTAATQIVADFQGLAGALQTREISSRVAELSLEMRGLNEEFAAMTMRTGELDMRRLEQFKTAADNVRRIRGSTPEIESKLVEGYLPKGFGLGAETQWDKMARERRELDESTDEWYRVINTDIQVKQQYTREQSARLAEVFAELAAKETQFSGLVEVLYRRVEELSGAIASTDDPSAELSELDEVVAVLDNLAGGYVDADAAQRALAQSMEQVTGIVEREAREQADAAGEVARAYARSPEGVERIEAARQRTAVEIALTRERVEAVRTEARQRIEAEKRLTVETAAQAKARQAQKTEAARRVTIRQRGTTTLAVAEGRFDLKEQERQNKLLGEAQKLAAELGLAWTDIDARMLASGESLESVIGGLKRAKTEQATANRETQKNAQLQTQAQQLAQNLGVSWEQIEAAMQDSGASLQTVVRELGRVEAEQRQIRAETAEIAEKYRGMGGAVRLFVAELEKARRERQGLYAIANDLQQIGNSLKMNAGLVTGAVVTAARDYTTFAKQSDVAARSLSLSADLTQQLRQLTIEQSATLAVQDPEQTARGVTIWAQATGQVVDSQEELNALLKQTIPIQQAAALSQTDVATLTEATAGAINQFGLGVADTTRVVSVFNKVADDTLVSVGDVAESFKYVGPTADRLNLSIEETAGLLAILGDNGIRGTMAGTSLGRMMENLLVPNSEDAKKTLNELFGSESPFFTAQGTFVGMERALDMLAAATADMTDQQREAALATLFDVNGLRALTPLLRAQKQAREEGTNALRQASREIEQGALSTWEQQISDWEASDVYAVQQAQMRWKALWLSIGQQGVQLALPALQEVSQWIEKLSATIQANPWMVQAVTAVAGGLLAAGTIITAVGTVSKLILGVETLVSTYKATLVKAEAARANFSTAVATAAEKFRLIITRAATEAAQIEKQGAVEEGAIEKKDAVEEGAIEKGSALSVGKILGSALLAATVAEVGSQMLTGQSITGWGSSREGQAAAAQRMAGLEGASPDELRGVLADLKDDLVLLDKYVVKEGEEGPGMLLNPDYWKDAIFGAGGADTEQLRELMGGTMGTLSGQALADKYAEVEATIQGIGALLAESGGDYNDAGVRVAQMMQELSAASEDLGEQLYQQGAVTKGLASLTEDQKENIVDIYAEMLQAQADAVREFQEALAEAERDLQRDLADLARDYEKNRAAEEASFYADAAKAAEDYRQREAEALAQHQKDMQRMREDHEMRVWDLTLSRDAAGLYKENQQYETERQRAEQDFAEERARSAQEFAAEQAQRAAQHAQKMAELALQYETERAQRLADHATQVEELQAEHTAEMERLRREYFERLNAESGYYQQSQLQQRMYQNAMLADAQSFLFANRQQWMDYIASLPVPSGDRYIGVNDPTVGEFQEGGYVRQTGAALLHAGEFVMSPQTTRQLEGAVGGRLTQQSVVNRGVTVQATFNGMASGDRAWFETRLQDFSRELAGMLS